MKTGDLVKFRNQKRHPGKMFLVTHTWSKGHHVSLLGFPENQVFQFTSLEVVNEGG